ncbi:MAG: glycosyltransferase family 4 protein [Chloroflexi bacterium]|nr:glycosyltransferase family 4 protein [Chloroflexota bacterium]
MKLALASLHPRRLSGQIESLLALGTALQEIGHAVSLFSPMGEGAALSLHSGDSDFYPNGHGPLVGSLGRMMRVLVRLTQVQREVDLIHLALPTPAFAWMGDYLRARVTRPLVIGFEGQLAPLSQVLPRLPTAPRFYGPRALFNNRWVARLSRFTSLRYIVSTLVQAEELTGLGVAPGRIVVLPNLSLLAPRDSRTPRHVTSVPWVTYIGHYHPVKGVDVLLRAFPLVGREIPEAQLVLAWSGIGDPRPVYRLIGQLGMAAQTIHLGKISVPELLSASRVLAFPYRLSIGQNLYPNLLLSALGTGVPLVSTELPAFRELLRDQETALLVPPEDAQSLAEAILRLLRDVPLARRMVAQQREFAREHLAPRRLARAYADMYHQVLDEGR